MPLRKVREQRKKLGAGAKRAPRTVTLLVLLVLVILLMYYLGRV
jgi:hypothetical protein